MKDLSDIRLDMIKQELDHIESAIRKIDDITNSIKNWAIVTWAGMLTLLLRESDLRRYIVITAILPIAFLLVDARWRKVQRSFIYRMRLISEFLNSDDLDQKLCKPLNSDFILLDPRARFKHRDDYRAYTSLKRILKFGTVSWLYGAMILMSVGLGAILLLM